MELPIEPTGAGRGGFRRPFSTRQFIIDHLAAITEDHPSSIHRAYKAALKELTKPVPVRKGPGRKPKPRHYKPSNYYSFTKQLQAMENEGIIKRSGRSELSNSERVEYWEQKPIRHYYTLA